MFEILTGHYLISLSVLNNWTQNCNAEPESTAFHILFLNTSFICHLGPGPVVYYNIRRTSVALTLMACLPWLFPTLSIVPWEQIP